jgi:hypothetical protein
VQVGPTIRHIERGFQPVGQLAQNLPSTPLRTSNSTLETVRAKTIFDAAKRSFEAW